MMSNKEWGLKTPMGRFYPSALKDGNVDIQRSQCRDAEKEQLYRNLYFCFCFVLLLQCQGQKQGLVFPCATERQLFIHKRDVSLGHESLQRGACPKTETRTKQQKSCFIQDICREKDNAV